MNYTLIERRHSLCLCIFSDISIYLALPQIALVVMYLFMHDIYTTNIRLKDKHMTASDHSKPYFPGSRLTFKTNQ